MESRLGSERLVSEKFELLQDIRGKNPAVTSLPSAITLQMNQHNTKSRESEREAKRKLEEKASGIDMVI